MIVAGFFILMGMSMMVFTALELKDEAKTGDRDVT